MEKIAAIMPAGGTGDGKGRMAGRVAQGWHRARRPLGVLGILALGIGGFAAQVALKPEVTREAPSERVWSVEAVGAARGDYRPDMAVMGTLVAGRTAELRPLVAGTISWVSPVLRDGGTVKAGEALLRIEALDYQLALDQSRAELAEAKARLDELRANAKAEQARAELARQQITLKERDLDRHQSLYDKGTIAIARLEQAQMALAQERQTATAMENGYLAGVARVRQQEAIIDRLQAQLTRAQTDLARTELTAPFDGYVGQVAAEVGMRVSAGDRVALLSGVEGLEARVALSTEAYGRLVASGDGVVGRPAQVSWRLGAERLSYAGRVERVIDRIDTGTGGVAIFVRLDGGSTEQPLRPGAFVEVNLPDRAYAGVYRLPATALHGDDTVYHVDGQGRLAAAKVQVVARTVDSVIVGAGLTEGQNIVTTRFQEIGPGLKVTTKLAAATVQSPDALPTQQAETPVQGGQP